MIGWQNTRNALGKLEELLTCKVCSNLVSDPCSLQACDHIFCRNCVEKLVGTDSKCPECGAFTWVKDMKTNRQLANTVSMCTRMRMLVGSGDDDEEFDDRNDDDFCGEDKTHTDNIAEAAVVWEETQPTFDQEMDSYQFSSPDVVLAATSMNKCDAAVQEIARNNKKKPTEPVKIKTYSRGQMKIATKSTKTKQIGADRAHKGNRNSDVEQMKHDGGKVLICQSGILSSGQDDIKENVSKQASKFSSSPQVGKRLQAKQKCFGKPLKERKFKMTASSRDFENKGQNDAQLTKEADILQFGSNESSDTDKVKENVKEKSFTRLRSRNSGTCMSGTLTAMFSKELSQEQTPKTVKSAPQTRAQKRSSEETIPQNEPDIPKDLVKMDNEKGKKKKKNMTDSKETPVKPQGSNKRKMSEQHFHSPKNTTLCSPGVKKNKRGETPLHVAAIKGCVETVRKLLVEGADPNTKDHAGWTPLHEACNHGYLTITELLLDHGALIDVPGGFDHDTPLHDAVTNGRMDVARLLVSKGAPLNVRNKQGLLPIDYATTEEMLAILSTPTPNTDDESSATVSSLLNEKGSQDLPKVLLATGLNSEQKANLQKCARILNASIVNEFSLSVTHIVTATNNKKGVCPRTIKYLNGVLTGKWIVSYEWILKCLRHKTWVDEASHEVKGTNDAVVDTPRRARINSLKQLPGLFDGCQFYFSGEFHPPHPSKEDLIQMVKFGGGKILSREPKPDVDESLCLPTTRDSNKTPNHATTLATVAYHAKPSSKQYRCTRYIIYDLLAEKNPHIWKTDSVCSMPSTWLMDCASNFAILDSE